VEECKVNATTLTTALTTQTKGGKMKKVGGFHWRMYEDCSEELKATYTDPLPEPGRSKTSSKAVMCVDPATDEVIKTFGSIQDVCDFYKCAYKTVKERCKTGDIYKGYKWKMDKGTSEPTTTEPASAGA